MNPNETHVLQYENTWQVWDESTWTEPDLKRKSNETERLTIQTETQRKQK